MKIMNMTHTVIGVANFVVRRVFALGVINFAPKGAKGHTTMPTVQ